MSRYAAVEWTLTRLVISAFRHPAYYEDGQDIKRSFGRRLEQFRTLLTRDGPLRAYADELSRLYEAYSSFETDRHFFAHGFVRQKPRYGYTVYEFRHYDFIDGTPHHGSFEITLSELQGLVVRLEEAVAPLLKLLNRVLDEAGLPKPEYGYRDGWRPLNQ